MSFIMPVGTGVIPGISVAQFGMSKCVSTLRVLGSITAMYSVPPPAPHVAALLQVGTDRRKRFVCWFHTGASGVPRASGNAMVPRTAYGWCVSMNDTYGGSAVCVVTSSGFGFVTITI